MKLRYRRSQPRIPGGRQALPACVISDIKDGVDDLAKMYGISRSWVVAVLLAEALGVSDQTPVPKTKLLKKEKK